LRPYRELRHDGRLARPVSEVRELSADVYSYWTAPQGERAWGGVLHPMRKYEGALFLGIVPLVLAGIGVAAATRAAAGRAALEERSRGPRWLVLGVGIAAGAALLALVFLLAGPVIPAGEWLARIGITSAGRALRLTALALVTLAALEPRVRAFARGVPGSAVAFFA